MMYEETIEGLRKIVQEHKGRLTPYMRLTICKAADAIEELSKEINKWQEIAYDWRDEYYRLLDNTPPLKATTKMSKEET